MEVLDQNSGYELKDKTKLQELEKILGYRFPKTFSKIVMSKNKAYFIKEEFLVETPDGFEEKSISALLDAEGDSNSVSSILGMWHTLQDEFSIPRDIVPFGVDGGGNLTCFDFFYDEPHIVYWQHDELWPPIEVAQSFSDFLAILR